MLALAMTSKTIRTMCSGWGRRRHLILRRLRSERSSHLLDSSRSRSPCLNAPALNCDVPRKSGAAPPPPDGRRRALILPTRNKPLQPPVVSLTCSPAPCRSLVRGVPLPWETPLVFWAERLELPASSTPGTCVLVTGLPPASRLSWAPHIPRVRRPSRVRDVPRLS